MVSYCSRREVTKKGLHSSHCWLLDYLVTISAMHQILILIYCGFIGAARSQRSIDATTLIVCEGGEFVAQCPTSSSVNVTMAEYGRTTTESICAKAGFQGTQLCRSERAFDLAHAHCKAKNICRMRASEDTLGRPLTKTGGWCFDVSLYVRVTYTCVRDCLPPTFSYDSEVFGSDYSVGSSVTVYCRTGYQQANGQRDGVTKTCMDDGTWAGATLLCRDIDECENPSTKRCHMFATCKNTRGSYRCMCTSGYHGDGISCTSDKWFTDDELADKDGDDELTEAEDWDAAALETHDESVCGPAILRQRHGVLKSPGHPGNYPSNVKCIWAIMVPPHYVIELRFMRFNLESQKQNAGCYHDNVTIYDNLNRDPRWWRGTYCGNDAPVSVMSQKNKVRIELMSDDVVEYTGFEIRFTAINLNFACLNFPAPSHDGIVVMNGGRNGTTPPRKSLRLTCERGYSSPTPTFLRTCQLDGTWDDFSNPCEPISCGEPYLPVLSEGLIVRALPSRFRYNEEPVRYSCDVGYKMQVANGYDDVITCDIEGRWSNAEHKITPWCEKIICYCQSVASCALVDGGRPPHNALRWVVKDHEDHVIDNPVGQKFSYGSQIEYSCVDGYVVTGDKYRLCTADGWSGRRTSCQTTNLGLTNYHIAIIASASSAFVILVVALALVICCCHGRKKKKKRKQNQERRMRAAPRDNPAILNLTLAGNEDFLYANSIDRRDRGRGFSGRHNDITKYQTRPYLLPGPGAPDDRPTVGSFTRPGNQSSGNSSQSRDVERPATRAAAPRQEESPSSRPRRNSLSRIAQPPPGYQEPPPGYDTSMREIRRIDR